MFELSPHGDLLLYIRHAVNNTRSKEAELLLSAALGGVYAGEYIGVFWAKLEAEIWAEAMVKGEVRAPSSHDVAAVAWRAYIAGGMVGAAVGGVMGFVARRLTGPIIGIGAIGLSAAIGGLFGAGWANMVALENFSKLLQAELARKHFNCFHTAQGQQNFIKA